MTITLKNLIVGVLCACAGFAFAVAIGGGSLMPTADAATPADEILFYKEFHGEKTGDAFCLAAVKHYRDGAGSVIWKETDAANCEPTPPDPTPTPQPTPASSSAVDVATARECVPTLEVTLGGEPGASHSCSQGAGQVSRPD